MVPQLLDTHVFLAVVEERTSSLPLAIREHLKRNEIRFHLSIASLWEIAIKHRLGKLPLPLNLEKLGDAAHGYGIALLTINEHHVLHAVVPEPPTRDPFDRLLLAKCAVENMQLLTIDRALENHPLSATAP